jgi:hypothetical protein
MHKESTMSKTEEEMYFRDRVKDFGFDWVPVAHACNPSYSRGRDQEDCSSKPA